MARRAELGVGLHDGKDEGERCRLGGLLALWLGSVPKELGDVTRGGEGRGDGEWLSLGVVWWS